MIWSDKDLEHLGLTELDALGKSSHLLGFNEPNFESQVRSLQYRKYSSSCIVDMEHDTVWVLTRAICEPFYASYRFFILLI